MPTLVTIYHKDLGRTEMTSVSAEEALSHGDEWALTSWPGQDTAAPAGAGPTSREQAVEEGLAPASAGMTTEGVSAGLPAAVSPVPPNYVVPLPTLAMKTSFGDSASGELPADGARAAEAEAAHTEAAANAGSADKGDDPDANMADEEFGAYSVKHKGRGSYAVMKGDEVVAEGLSKADAEAKAGELNTAG